QSGAPWAPLYMGVRDAHGVRSSRRATPLPPRSHLDELSRTMGYTEAVGLSKPVVHIVDREADAVRQVRRWHRRERLFLIRAQDIRLGPHGERGGVVCVLGGARPGGVSGESGGGLSRRAGGPVCGRNGSRPASSGQGSSAADAGAP